MDKLTRYYGTTKDGGEETGDGHKNGSSPF